MAHAPPPPTGIDQPGQPETGQRASALNLRRWIGLLSGPTMVTAGLMASALAAQTILYRVLLPAEAGSLALVLSLAQTVALVGGLGQQALFARIYSRHPEGTFNWRKDGLTTLALTLPALIVATAGAAVINRMGLPVAGYVLAASALQLVTGLLGSLLSSHRHYGWSTALARLPVALLVLPAGIALLLAGDVRFAVAMGSYLVFGLGNVVLGLWLAGRLAPKGDQLVSLRQRLLGLILLVSALTVLLPDDGFISLAGGMVLPASLAGYASVLLPFGLFKLIYGVMILVLITELARADRPNYVVLTVLTWAGALAAGLLAVAIGPSVVHLLYGGRYDWAAYLVPWFTVGGVLQLTESLPLSHMVGRAGEEALNRFVIAQIVLVAAGVAALYALVPQFGVRGIAIAACAVYVGRNILAYASLAATSRHPAPSRPG